jgi:hypothetical protein
LNAAISGSILAEQVHHQADRPALTCRRPLPSFVYASTTTQASP